ncbi:MULTISPECIES: DUF4352 domain-containing protein [Pseudofrankia]|uniref:DUF4352 domain-containing protein n=1 Tax=Pseudofrankia TaxID=2994363 RepID=UPI0002EE80DC|nr:MULTISPECIES: DUF4352 domain-containing protein [Pseudofrankia]OHV33200.1 hypothetical protein BCD49_27560 [Pseudofrankia sp. EUN1h]
MGALLVLAMAACWLSAIALGGRPSNAPTREAASPSASPRLTPAGAAPSATAPAGAFQDGPLEFTVDKVECGVTQLGEGFLAWRPNGQFCLVAVTARDVDSAAPQLRSSDQYGFDSAGGRHTADFAARLYEPGETIWRPVSPGSSTARSASTFPSRPRSNG